MVSYEIGGGVHLESPPKFLRSQRSYIPIVNACFNHFI